MTIELVFDQVSAATMSVGAHRHLMFPKILRKHGTTVKPIHFTPFAWDQDPTDIGHAACIDNTGAILQSWDWTFEQAVENSTAWRDAITVPARYSPERRWYYYDVDYPYRYYPPYANPHPDRRTCEFTLFAQAIPTEWDEVTVVFVQWFADKWLSSGGGAGLYDLRVALNDPAYRLEAYGGLPTDSSLAYYGSIFGEGEPGQSGWHNMRAIVIRPDPDNFESGPHPYPVSVGLDFHWRDEWEDLSGDYHWSCHPSQLKLTAVKASGVKGTFRDTSRKGDGMAVTDPSWSAHSRGVVGYTYQLSHHDEPIAMRSSSFTNILVTSYDMTSEPNDLDPINIGADYYQNSSQQAAWRLGAGIAATNNDYLGYIAKFANLSPATDVSGVPLTLHFGFQPAVIYNWSLSTLDGSALYEPLGAENLIAPESIRYTTFSTPGIDVEDTTHHIGMDSLYTDALWIYEPNTYPVDAEFLPMLVVDDRIVVFNPSFDYWVAAPGRIYDWSEFAVEYVGPPLPITGVGDLHAPYGGVPGAPSLVRPDDTIDLGVPMAYPYYSGMGIGAPGVGIPRVFSPHNLQVFSLIASGIGGPLVSSLLVILEVSGFLAGGVGSPSISEGASVEGDAELVVDPDTEVVGALAVTPEVDLDFASRLAWSSEVAASPSVSHTVGAFPNSFLFDTWMVVDVPVVPEFPPVTPPIVPPEVIPPGPEEEEPEPTEDVPASTWVEVRPQIGIALLMETPTVVDGRPTS